MAKESLLRPKATRGPEDGTKMNSKGRPSASTRMAALIREAHPEESRRALGSWSTKMMTGTKATGTPADKMATANYFLKTGVTTRGILSKASFTGKGSTFGRVKRGLTKAAGITTVEMVRASRHGEVRPTMGGLRPTKCMEGGS